MKVFTEAKYETPIYGVGKVALAGRGFSITAQIETEDGQREKKTWSFKNMSALPEELPEAFVLEEIKYAFVLSSDGKEIKFIRPANLRGASFKFAGFLTTKDGDFLLKQFDAKDKEGNKTGKKIIKFIARWLVVGTEEGDPYAGLEYPQTLPFTNSYGEPHFRATEDGGVMVQGNAEWKGKPTNYAGLLNFLEATGLSDEETEFEAPDSSDVQDWLAEMERLALENNRVVQGCDTTDGYISAWGESVLDETPKKKAAKKPAPKPVEEDDDEEVPAPKAKKAPAGRREVPTDED